MKKNLLFIALIVAFGLIVTTSISSCKTKEGCGLEEKYRAVDKDGNKSTKRGKSNLFSKKQRKKMKKRGQG